MLYLKHGGHVLDDTAKDAESVAKKGHAVLARRALPSDEVDMLRRTETPFDYLLPQLKARPGAHLPGDPASVVAALNKLGTAMVDDAPPAQTDPKAEVNSTIPAVYTYWGQFVDHDLTANTDRDLTTSDITKPDLKPVPPDEVDGEAEEPAPAHARPRQRLWRRAGHHRRGQQRRRVLRRRPLPDRQEQRQPGRAPIAGIKIPPEGDLDRDLPRIGPLLDAGVITEEVLPDALKDDPSKRTRAFIGDLRNDENLVVAQLHLAFLRFHNAVVDRIEANPRDFGLWPGKGRRFQAAVFHCARDVTRHIYQRITVHDYLRTVMFPGVVDKILVGGPKHYRPLRGYRAFMPLEYSVAAFRFGHTMVRGAYDHNRNFGKPAPGQTERPLIPFAPFDLLFLFTGNGFLRDPDDSTKSIRNPFGGTPTLPFNWIIEWDRFTDKGDPEEGRFARKIDTRLAPPLTTEGMVNEGDRSAHPGRGEQGAPRAATAPRAAQPAARLPAQHPDGASRGRRDGCRAADRGGAPPWQHAEGQRRAGRGRFPPEHAALVLRAEGVRGARGRQRARRAGEPHRVRDHHRPAPASTGTPSTTSAAGRQSTPCGCPTATRS